MDVCYFSQLQSTALPTELSKVVKNLIEMFSLLYTDIRQAMQVLKVYDLKITVSVV